MKHYAPRDPYAGLDSRHQAALSAASIGTLVWLEGAWRPSNTLLRETGVAFAGAIVDELCGRRFLQHACDNLVATPNGVTAAHDMALRFQTLTRLRVAVSQPKGAHP